MFGDFSRFSNDPELGLTGVYLSQGSPLLDSDWNEQVAGLTEWMTVVGRLACGDGTTERLRGIGFPVAWSDQTKQVEVGPGMALLGGRAIQSQSKFRAQRQAQGNQFHSPRIFSSDLSPPPNPPQAQPQPSAAAPAPGPVAPMPAPLVPAAAAAAPSPSAYLSVVSRNLPASVLIPSSTSWLSDAICDVTDWAIWLTEDPAMPDVRTVGDGQFLVPRLQLTAPPFKRWSGTCLVECHSVDIAGVRVFKVARTSHNLVPLGEITKLENKVRFKVPRGACRLLDLLDESETTLKAEFEDDFTVHLRAINTLRPAGEVIRLNDVSPLFEIKAVRETDGTRLTIESLNAAIEINASLRPVLRLWDVVDSPAALQLADLPVQEAQQYLVAGDRWYVPIEEGKSVDTGERGLPGRRIFRGVAKLPPAGLNGPATTSVEHPATQSDGAHNLVMTSAVFEPKEPGETVSAPVSSRPFNDSLYRLTSALNATRMLTRNTPCRELQTRVSFLPLRRWLASAYVHEIADLDLDTFMAKVQRSIDVPFEEESRFRDQAALVLEEARRIGGSLESETSSPVRWA